MDKLNDIEISKLIKSLDEKIFYCPNAGNAGDSLITCATIQFFEKFKINYEIISSMEFDAYNKTLIYGGGGNFGGFHSRGARFVYNFSKKSKNIVILPHTIFDIDQMISQIDENVYFICREKVSYNYLSCLMNNKKVYLSDDIVFYCNLKKLIDTKPNYKIFPYLLEKIMRIALFDRSDFGIGIKGFLSFTWFLIKENFNNNDNKKILFAFRKDMEKTEIKYPANNIDLSAVLELSACKLDLATLSTYYFLNTINKYREVHTNRLHVAIAATLLGKKIYFYPNSYYKNKAIYENSMANVFDNVIWKE